MPKTPGQQELLDIPAGTRYLLMASAGGDSQPASIVLRSLADTVKDLAEDVLANRRSEPGSDRGL